MAKVIVPSTKNRSLSPLPSIGILGGTFDPIHIGHLRSALEVKENLKLDEMRLIPVYFPPHRKPPVASPEHRLNMVRCAVKNTDLSVDDKEITRQGISYTVETLTSLREEFPNHSISIILGTDAFLKLQNWHQWEKILTLCNIIVIHRSGWSLNEETTNPKPIAKEIHDLLEKLHLQESEDESQSKNKYNDLDMVDLRKFRNGRIKTQKITLLEVSGRALRSMMAHGTSPQFLIPENVLKYIEENQLYGYNSLSISENLKGGK